MDRQNDIEGKIEDLLSEDTKIPKIVDIKSEKAYDMIRELHNSKNIIKKRNKYKQIAVGVVASLTLLFGIGTYNPSLADEIPILHNIFVKLNEKLGIGNKYSENNQLVQKNSTKNGVSINIDEAIFEGNSVYLTVKLKSETDLDLAKVERNVGENDIYQYILYDTDIKSSFGGEIDSSSGIVGYFEDSKTFIGMVHLTLTSSEKIPETLDIDLKIGEIGDVDMTPDEFMKGPWKFKFNVSLGENTKIINANKSQGKYKVNEIRVNPYGFTLDYEMPCDYVDIKDGFSNIEIYDDRGNNLSTQSYSVRDNDYKDSSEIIKGSISETFDIYSGIDGSQLEYIIVKFKDGRNVVVDDTIHVSEDGSAIEGPSYKGIPVEETEDIEFRIDLK